MKSVFISPFRFYLVFFTVFMAFSSLGGRLFYLQVVKADEFAEIAQSARNNFITLRARRGDVVDCKGNLLATTRSVVEVGMDPHSLEISGKEKFSQLAALLEIEVSKLVDASKKLTRRVGVGGGEIRDVRWIKLKDEVEERTSRKIRHLGIEGIYGNFKHSRLYPNRKLASHIL